jgi:Rad3-related DNA helicase
MSDSHNQSNWSVSVRQFVNFTRDSGHLSSQGQWRPSAQAGQEGHQLLQSQRPSNYHAEVPLRETFRGDGVALRLQGRIDGIFSGNTPILEEIKTTVQPTAALLTREAHWLQLYCYAWLFLRTTPHHHCIVQLTYFNVEQLTEKSFQVHTSETLLTPYFKPKLSQYLRWLSTFFSHRRARNQYLSSLTFPYEYERPQQVEIMSDVRGALHAHKCFLLEASTGIGKTAAVIFPALKQMRKSLRSRTFCLTAKITTQTNAQEFLLKVCRQDKPLKVLQITAQERTCLCDRTQQDQPCAKLFNYYQKIHAARQSAFEHSWLDTATLRTLAAKHEVCPYRLQFELVPWFDIIIGDYNYIFDPRANVLHLLEQDLKQTYLLIDECHNLIERTRDMFSATLNFQSLHALKQRFYAAPPAFAHSISQILAAAQAQLQDPAVPSLALQRSCAHTLKLLEQQLRLSADLVDSEILNHYFELHFFHRLLSLNESAIRVLPEDSLGHLSDPGSRISQSDYATSPPQSSGLSLFCVDPAPMLTPIWERIGGAILYSGTLQPSAYYQRLLGLDALEHTDFSHYVRDFAEQVSTQLLPLDLRYRQRSKAIPVLVDTIYKMTERLPGNHFIFFPSYKFMQQVHAAFKIEHPGITTNLQQANMTLQDRNRFLEQFEPNPRRSRVGFVVMGGVFGEGVDLPGDRLMGVMLVTIGLPIPDARIRAIEQYFTNEDSSGFSYAFLYPSLCRTLQASGRLIRTDEDEGILVLADQRFGQPAYLEAFAAYGPKIQDTHALIENEFPENCDPIYPD